MSVLSKTKTFFKAKPVRIIIALCVIAAIMVAVGIGISALVKKLSDKCANQPGTDWNSEVGKCVTRGCQNICKTGGRKGSCDDDMCTGSNEEGYPYVYDENLCECVLDCSNAGPYGSGEDLVGRKYTPFAANGNGQTSTTINNGNIEVPLICAIKCDLSGKTEYCNADDQVCGEFILDSSSSSGGGCLPYPKYKLCGEENPDYIACYQYGDNPDNNCIRDSSNKATRCKATQCQTSAGEDTIVIAHSSGECHNTSDYEKINTLPNVTINGITKDFSNFSPSSHYCKTKKVNASNDRCMSMVGLSEYKNGESIKLYDCKGHSQESQVGVSKYLPQCKDSIDNNACINLGYSLCENGWQASPNKQDTYCLSDNEVTPGNNWSNLETGSGYCCPNGERIKKDDGPYYCCNENTKILDNFCYRKTPGPFDMSLISGTKEKLYTAKTCILPAGKEILVETDTDDPHTISLQEYSNNLRTLVCGTDKDTATCSSNPEDKNYIGIICESGNEPHPGPWYKGVAGNDKGDVNYFMAPSGSDSEHSNIETYYIGKKSGCTAIIQKSIGGDLGNGLHACADNIRSKDSKLYWYPVSSGQYGFTQTLGFDHNCNKGAGSFMEELGQNVDSLYSIKYNKDKNDYDLVYDCNKLDVLVPKNDGSSTSIPWKDMNPVSHPEVSWNEVFNNSKYVSCSLQENSKCITNSFDSSKYEFVKPSQYKVPHTSGYSPGRYNDNIHFAQNGEYCYPSPGVNIYGNCKTKK